jgi:hypothetical protein
MGSIYSSCGSVYQAKQQIMSLLIIFGFGVFVALLFIIGVFYSNEEKNEINIGKVETDITDYDGGGNYGRIPDKKPKNRAI